MHSSTIASARSENSGSWSARAPCLAGKSRSRISKTSLASCFAPTSALCSTCGIIGCRRSFYSATGCSGSETLRCIAGRASDPHVPNSGRQPIESRASSAGNQALYFRISGSLPLLLLHYFHRGAHNLGNQLCGISNRYLVSCPNVGDLTNTQVWPMTWMKPFAVSVTNVKSRVGCKEPN